jgi:hypothetical protein
MRMLVVFLTVVMGVLGGGGGVAWAQDGVEPRYFVAVDGNDENPGTKEKPFATVEHALTILSLHGARNLRDGLVIVAVRGGEYVLEKPIVVTPGMSGQKGKPVAVMAYGDEKPVFSGGRVVTGWKVEDGRWTVTLPGVKEGNWRFAELYVNGERAYRPRLPARGYFYVQEGMTPTEGNAKKGFDRFKFKAGDIRADWQNLNDVEVVGFHLWSASRLKIKEVDEKGGVVTFAGTTPGTENWTQWGYNSRFLVENVKEAINPGEWYLDTKTGELTYLPKPGQTPENTRVVAPRLARLAEFRGEVEKGLLVSRVQLHGLTFEHANWGGTARGQSSPQAEANLGAAIYGVGMEACVIKNCTVSHVGEYGLWLGKGSKNNRVENCRVTDMGAGGIKIGEMDYFEKDALVASGNVVENCLIAHGGRVHSAGVGVWVGHSYGNKVLHNDIVDFYYSGISTGWAWGYGKSLAHHNEFAFNRIRQIGQGVLSDMGGVYMLGAGEGNHVHHNVIHDVDAYSYGGWGIYLDEGGSKVLVENNVVHDTKSAVFHQHYGRENVVRNNVFAFGKEAQIMRTRAEKHLSFTLERNIVVAGQGPIFGMNWTGDGFKLEKNVYWRTDGKAVVFPGGLSLEKWQAKGFDKDSVVGDPGFVDLAKRDFRLKADALALKVGFEAIDVSQAGRVGVQAYEGKMGRAFPMFEYPPGKAVREGFESVAVGEKTPVAKTVESGPDGVARVTEEVFGEGKKCLRFTDSSSGAEYNPHVYWEPHFKEGKVAGSFLLRPEAGAMMRYEWRDYQGAYVAGPSIYVGVDGGLKVGAAEVVKLPLGAWSKIEVACVLGSGEWVLKVTPAKGAAVEKEFNCDKQFKWLDWVGVTSHATQKTVFYVDDVVVRVKDGEGK